MDQVQVWEANTLAPLDSFRSEKFFVAANTLAVERDGHIVGSHLQKTSMAVWKWDLMREPCLRSPLKEEVTALRLYNKMHLITATKKGSIQVF
jgi:hypothetical protein